METKPYYIISAFEFRQEIRWLLNLTKFGLRVPDNLQSIILAIAPGIMGENFFNSYDITISELIVSKNEPDSVIIKFTKKPRDQH